MGHTTVTNNRLHALGTNPSSSVSIKVTQSTLFNVGLLKSARLGKEYRVNLGSASKALTQLKGGFRALHYLRLFFMGASSREKYLKRSFKVLHLGKGLSPTHSVVKKGALVASEVLFSSGLKAHTANQPTSVALQLKAPTEKGVTPVEFPGGAKGYVAIESTFSHPENSSDATPLDGSVTGFVEHVLKEDELCRRSLLSALARSLKPHEFTPLFSTLGAQLSSKNLQRALDNPNNKNAKGDLVNAMHIFVNENGKATAIFADPQSLVEDLYTLVEPNSTDHFIQMLSTFLASISAQSLGSFLDYTAQYREETLKYRDSVTAYSSSLSDTGSVVAFDAASIEKRRRLNSLPRRGSISSASSTASNPDLAGPTRAKRRAPEGFHSGTTTPEPVTSDSEAQSDTSSLSSFEGALEQESVPSQEEGRLAKLANAGVQVLKDPKGSITNLAWATLGLVTG